MNSDDIDYSRMFRLDGKVALVTGGARGIGAEVCRALAAAGAKVMATDLLEDRGRATVEALKQSGAKAAFRKQDVCDEAQWEASVAATLDLFGGLDILVNNAGVENLTFLGDTTLADFQNVIDINVTGVFLGCKHAVRVMRRAALLAVADRSSICLLSLASSASRRCIVTPRRRARCG